MQEIIMIGLNVLMKHIGKLELILIKVNYYCHNISNQNYNHGEGS